jgi:type IV secretory pathway protease TraF
MSNVFINHLRVRLRRCRIKKSIKKGLISFGVGFVVCGFISEQVRFIKSPTDSLPEHYFVQLTKFTPTKGDLTIVHNQFYGGSLIKKIIGQAGDRISTDAVGDLWVGQKLVGKVYPQTGEGKKLTRTKDQVIPEGEVFLYSPHPKSFDSRYQEVGLVPVVALEGLVIAIV